MVLVLLENATFKGTLRNGDLRTLTTGVLRNPYNRRFKGLLQPAFYGLLQTAF